MKRTTPSTSADEAIALQHAVFISDANNFGQSSLKARIGKQILHGLSLWPAADYIRTGFRGYHRSEGDGIFYSYSIFNDVTVIKRKFPNIAFMNTRPGGPNLFRSAQTIAVHVMKFKKADEVRS